MLDITKLIDKALARVPTETHQGLLTMRENALRFGVDADPLIAAIDARLANFQADGGMAVHRLEFARQMLKLVERSGRQWVEGRDIFNRARLEFSDNPFVIWMAGNSARQIPVTAALDRVLPEFPHIERRKEGTAQSDRIQFRVRVS